MLLNMLPTKFDAIVGGTPSAKKDRDVLRLMDVWHEALIKQNGRCGSSSAHLVLQPIWSFAAAAHSMGP